MDEVEPGDLILSYADQHVKAWSVALAPSNLSRRPDSLPTTMWEQDGRLLRARYVDAANPVHREEIPEGWREAEPREGPFQANLAVKLGYLFPLTEQFYENFGNAFADRFDTWTSAIGPIAPAEALDGASNLMRRLIGEELRTFAGDLNVILAVRPAAALVKTARSPNGQWVQTEWVESALERLLREGAISVTPESVGHRSAFVGAVLSTIPGTRWDPKVPLLRFASDPVPETATSETLGSQDRGFEGDLEIPNSRAARGEQANLRKALVGGATEANCAICGELLPIQFLWAAHIKKRSACSDDEKRDLASIAMLACVLGCDALFETGHIAVDSNGHILASEEVRSPVIARRLESLSGANCSSFTESSAEYFRWHRLNIFRGAVDQKPFRPPSV